MRLTLAPSPTHTLPDSLAAQPGKGESGACFLPSLSLLLRLGWPPPVTSHAMPITSAAGTVPAVGVASEHSAQDGQREGERRREGRENRIQVKPQGNRQRKLWLKPDRTVWPGAGRCPEEASQCPGLMFHSHGVWHVSTGDFPPGFWRLFQHTPILPLLKGYRRRGGDRHRPPRELCSWVFHQEDVLPWLAGLEAAGWVILPDARN